MTRTYDEINERIQSGEAVVVTAEEMVDIVDEQGAEKAAETVDVVTTGTFAPMCSSGALINTGHTSPRMRISEATLNDVPAYSGLAAVDLYIGATELPENDPRNRDHPGLFPYGGGHVIQDLIAGKDVRLTAESYGTDCYPRTNLDTWINIETLNQASLLNPRNGYQNYNVAVNLREDRDIYTYLGVVKPDLGSANFCSAGQLSPLLNDPYYRTIGIGTRIFLGGGVGYVFHHGTQHNPSVARSRNGVPKEGAGTIAVTGDMKQMRPDLVVGVSMYGYGVSLALGIGIPIPILNADMARYTGVSDDEIVAPIVDYSKDYPENDIEVIDHVSYAELKTGQIEVRGKTVPTTPMSSHVKAQAIARELKEWIEDGEFLLAEPVELLPSADSGMGFRGLPERPIDNRGVK